MGCKIMVPVHQEKVFYIGVDFTNDNFPLYQVDQGVTSSICSPRGLLLLIDDRLVNWLHIVTYTVVTYTVVRYQLTIRTNNWYSVMNILYTLDQVTKIFFGNFNVLDTPRHAEYQYKSMLEKTFSPNITLCGRSIVILVSQEHFVKHRGETEFSSRSLAM